MPPNAASSLASALGTHPQNAQAISQCLLQIISNSSPAALRRQCLAIVQPTITSLSNMVPIRTRQLKPAPAISYQLRILSAMITKVGSAALIDLSSQVDHIRACYQRPVPAQDTSLSRRPFEVVPQRPVPLNAGPSRRNFTSSSQFDPSSNLDTGEPSQTEHSTQLILDALALLTSIAEVDTKALHPFWAQLLPAHGYPIHQAHTLVDIVERDPEFAVRIKACRVVKLMLTDSGPYMAIAEEQLSSKCFIRFSPMVQDICSATILV